MHQLSAQIAVTPFADSEQPFPAAGRVLARGETEPRGKAPAAGKGLRVDDRRHHRCRDHRADAGDCGQPLGGLVVASLVLQTFVELGEACCEAVQRPSMRFVRVKSETQQSLLMLHRIRDRLVAERTGTISAVRGHMAEFGIVAARRGLGMKELLAIISDLDDPRLPPMARELLVLQVKHLRAIETRI